MNFTRLAAALSGAGFLVAHAVAVAGPTHSVLLNGFTYGAPSIVTVQSAAPGTPIAPFSVHAGQYSGFLDGNPFVSFCVELTQYLYFGAQYNDYTVVDGVTAWGAAKSATFDRLISSMMGGITNATASGLAQAAVWEALYETASSFGFASGTFTASSPANPQIQMNGMDWAAVAATPVRYHVDLLHSPTAQDLILITPFAVPEPGMGALAAVGGIALLGAGRRRKLRGAVA